jgi:hypothetical protein
MSLPATQRNLATDRGPNGGRDRTSRRRGRPVGLAGPAVFLILCRSHPAAARPARCFTSDNGFYDCAFVAGRRGGFTISAPGKPTVILDIDAPGIAYGFAGLGGRNVALPGRYRRAATDPACWDNDVTGARVCAWSRP